MRDTLEQAKLWCKQDEGGFDDDPDDPGGATKFGINLYDYREFVDSKGTAEDVRELSLEKAFEIYEVRYWGPCSCDILPRGLDYFTFDSAILSGVRTAILWLQRATGVDPDGILGPKSLHALEVCDHLSILSAMETLRRHRLRTLPTWPKYGRGWTNRVNRAVVRSKKLISKEMPIHAKGSSIPASVSGDIK